MSEKTAQVIRSHAAGRRISQGQVIEELASKLQPLTSFDKRAACVDTLIPLETLRQILAWRDEQPPVPYRAIASRTGFALRTVNRAARGLGNYQAKHRKLNRGKAPYFAAGQIAEIREQAKTRSQTEIARELQVNPSTISRIVRGKGAYKL